MAKKRSNKELLESFSNLVDQALYIEAVGPAIKAGMMAGKGLVKNIAKHGLKGLTKANVLQNIGASMVNDVKQMASDAYDATPLGALHNTFKDEEGNWSFNPVRALKKQVGGAVKTADNLLTGGMGQMAYDAIAGDDDEQQTEVQPTQVAAQASVQKPQPQAQTISQQMPAKQPIKKGKKPAQNVAQQTQVQ